VVFAPHGVVEHLLGGVDPVLEFARDGGGGGGGRGWGRCFGGG